MLVKEKGFASAIVIVLSAAMLLISFLVIKFGIVSLNVFKEKQVLDSCSLSLGKGVLETNDTNNLCTSNFLNNCGSLLELDNPDYLCIDEGTACDDQGLCERKFYISSTYNPGRGFVTKTNEIIVKEENHDVSIIDAAVIMLLDFSGSMSGNRIVQLKNTVRSFIDSNFNLSFSVILYNNEIIDFTEVDKGNIHNLQSNQIITANNPGGGTNFIKPLRVALDQINNTNYESYYIILISDGSPNEGIESSVRFVDQNINSINQSNCINTTRAAPCITLYTLGVDNADQGSLTRISGNVLDQGSSIYNYVVNSNNVNNAFNAIIEEIVCKIGPVFATPPINIFNGTDILEENEDYSFDIQTKVFKFYNVEPFNVCDEMINNNTSLTLRWGKVKVNVVD